MNLSHVCYQQISVFLPLEEVWKWRQLSRRLQKTVDDVLLIKHLDFNDKIRALLWKRPLTASGRLVRSWIQRSLKVLETFKCHRHPTNLPTVKLPTRIERHGRDLLMTDSSVEVVTRLLDSHELLYSGFDLTLSTIGYILLESQRTLRRFYIEGPPNTTLRAPNYLSPLSEELVPCGIDWEDLLEEQRWPNLTHLSFACPIDPEGVEYYLDFILAMKAKDGLPRLQMLELDEFSRMAASDPEGRYDSLLDVPQVILTQDAVGFHASELQQRLWRAVARGKCHGMRIIRAITLKTFLEMAIINHVLPLMLENEEAAEGGEMTIANRTPPRVIIDNIECIFSPACAVTLTTILSHLLHHSGMEVRNVRAGVMAHPRTLMTDRLESLSDEAHINAIHVMVQLFGRQNIEKAEGAITSWIRENFINRSLCPRAFSIRIPQIHTGPIDWTRAPRPSLPQVNLAGRARPPYLDPPRGAESLEGSMSGDEDQSDDD